MATEGSRVVGACATAGKIAAGVASSLSTRGRFRAVIGDTIFATASAPGPSARAIVRFSGPLAFESVEAALDCALPRERAQRTVSFAIEGFCVEALVLCMPGPRSYTGEDCVELHVPGSAMLVAELCARSSAAMSSGLRPALPGEFTARACQNGRMDLAQAEGVLMLVHGEDVAQIRSGASWLAGGLSASVARIRSRCQDGLALLEAGLDFEQGDTGEVEESAWRLPLLEASKEAASLLAAMPRAAVGGEAMLLGASNAGKSSLCNALLSRDELLVHGAPGTTRDLVRVVLPSGAALWDAPGDLDDPGEVDRAALRLRERLSGRAAAALLVVDPRAPQRPFSTTLPCLAVVWTKRDVAGPPTGAQRSALFAAAPFAEGAAEFSVSSRTGEGIASLAGFLAQRSRSGAFDPGAPVRHALEGAVAALDRAAGALQPELASQDAQDALRRLDQIDGRHGVDDLLDRIYGRFCLGK